jgi:hypothetical protein
MWGKFYAIGAPGRGKSRADEMGQKWGMKTVFGGAVCKIWDGIPRTWKAAGPRHRPGYPERLVPG